MNQSVKKVALAVALCSAFSGIPSAMAGLPSGDKSAKTQGAAGGNNVTPIKMRLIGTVSQSTCEIRPFTSEGADATTLNMGTVLDDKTNSDAVDFYLKPFDGCTNGINVKSTAQIIWNSNGLNEHGISNNGTAENIHVELKPIDDDGNAGIHSDSVLGSGDLIKTGYQTVNYTGLISSDGRTIKPFHYRVNFASNDGKNMKAGTVDTEVSYTVAYM